MFRARPNTTCVTSCLWKLHDSNVRYPKNNGWMSVMTSLNHPRRAITALFSRTSNVIWRSNCDLCFKSFSTAVYFLHGVSRKHQSATFDDTPPACGLCAENHTHTHTDLQHLSRDERVTDGGGGWRFTSRIRLARRSVRGLARGANFQNTGCNFDVSLCFWKCSNLLQKK